MLAYSWLPGGQIMTGQVARITLESFYHCGDGDSSAPLAIPLQREVTACDYPIEHVEKAVVWRLQQPSSTKAALFVDAFNLSAAQLNQLLAIGDSLNYTRNSTPSEVELDHAACLWLNSNTDTWEAWLPDSELYDTLLYQWDWWLGICGAVSLVGGLLLYGYLQYFKKREEEAEAEAEDATYSSRCSSWPDQPADRYPVVECLRRTFCCSLINSEKWEPVFNYLSNALRCMGHFRLIFFALGQLLVVACSWIELYIYRQWLTSGLYQLSLEVTISCGILMLALKLVKWGLMRLPNGEQTVRRQLQIRLRIKYYDYTKRDSILQDQQETDTKLYCVKQFDTAIKSTASELAIDCYSAAGFAFVDLFGFVAGLVFFNFYFGEFIFEGEFLTNYFLTAAIVSPYVWLTIVLIIGPLAKKLLVTQQPTTKAAYSGIMWTCEYFCYAFGPAFINPLTNDFGAGTNFIRLTDLLIVSN